MGWREEMQSAAEGAMFSTDEGGHAIGKHSLAKLILAMPAPDRIAMARELLEGTGLTINAADVGSCPFDREDHGGLCVDDPCPVCGSDGYQVPTGCTARRKANHDPR